VSIIDGRTTSIVSSGVVDAISQCNKIDPPAIMTFLASGADRTAPIAIGNRSDSFDLVLGDPRACNKIVPPFDRDFVINQLGRSDLPSTRRDRRGSSGPRRR